MGGVYASMGFHSVPFSLTPDTSLAYPGDQYVNVYRQLYFACTTGALGVLTAEVGLGKTLMIRCLLRGLPEHFRVAYLINPLLDSAALLAEILDDLSPQNRSASASVAELRQMLVRHMTAGAQQGLRYVVIVDEAHRLSAEALETLRLLSNLETEHVRLVSLLLVGQPELDKTLALRAMRPLRERIGVWSRLSALNRDDCSAYVRHRLKECHQDGSVVVSKAALTWLHWRTKGVPRRVNLACERAVLRAGMMGKRHVSWVDMWSACRQFGHVWR
jgi:general secretion pathway protein A